MQIVVSLEIQNKSFLGKSNHATQFLFKVSALKLLYRIKNKIKIATDVQRNSQTLVNCEVMKKMADAASHLPSHPTFPPRMDQGTGSVDITPSLCGDQPVLLSCLPGRHLLGLDLWCPCVCVCVCVCVSRSVMFNSSWPHELQLARLPCPWDFPGKNTGVGYHFLLQQPAWTFTFCCLPISES